MPDDENQTEGTEQTAPDGGEDEQVVLTKTQIDQLYASARNSAFAEARKTFSRPAAREQAEDPRVKRGLELLAKYDGAQRELQDSFARQDGITAAFSARRAATQKPAPAAQQPATSDIGQLVELMKLDIASRMADKMPKAAPQYATHGDQVRTELNASVADIQGDASLTDGARLDRIQQTVLKKLSGVKVAPVKPNNK